MGYLKPCQHPISFNSMKFSVMDSDAISFIRSIDTRKKLEAMLGLKHTDDDNALASRMAWIVHSAIRNVNGVATGACVGWYVW